MASSGLESWLRQDGTDGQSVMSARAVADQGLSLTGVIVYQFDPQGRFVERIDADKASLNDGYWELHKALVSRPGREPESFDAYTVSTYLTRERVGEALGSEIAVSLWQLPSLIEVAERAGLSAARYKMQYALLMSRPMLLMAMVILGATVSLRSFRSGGIQTMVITGMVGGIGFFLLTEVSRQIGIAGLVSPTTAVWVPIGLALLVVADGVATPGGRLSDASGADTAHGVRQYAGLQSPSRRTAAGVCARAAGRGCRRRDLPPPPRPLRTRARPPARLRAQVLVPQDSPAAFSGRRRRSIRRSRSICRPTSCSTTPRATG